MRKYSSTYINKEIKEKEAQLKTTETKIELLAAKPKNPADNITKFRLETKFNSDTKELEYMKSKLKVINSLFESKIGKSKKAHETEKNQESRKIEDLLYTPEKGKIHVKNAIWAHNRGDKEDDNGHKVNLWFYSGVIALDDLKYKIDKLNKNKSLSQEDKSKLDKF